MTLRPAASLTADPELSDRQHAETGTMVPVSNERQARELAPLRDDPEALASAWQAANEAAAAKGKPVTAADVAAAVAGALSNMLDTPPPANARQARPLAPRLPPADAHP